MLPRQDKKFAHPGEAPGHTGKRKSESSHACSVTPRKSVRGDQFLGPPEAKALNGNLKTNPHRTLNLFKLAPISPQPRRTKEDGSFHTPCTFGADKAQAILSETPTVVEGFAVYAQLYCRLQSRARFSQNLVTTTDFACARSAFDLHVTFSIRFAERNAQSGHASRRAKSESGRHHKALNRMT